MECIFPAPKRDLVLVQFIKQVSYADMHDFRDHVIAQGLSPSQLKEMNDLRIEMLPAIQNNSEYVLLLSGSHLDREDLEKAISVMLSDDSPYLFVYYNSHLSIKRIKKDLVPFL